MQLQHLGENTVWNWNREVPNRNNYWFSQRTDEIIFQPQKCPNCDQDSYFLWECKHCWYGQWQRYIENQLKKEKQAYYQNEQKKVKLSHALQGNGKKYEIWKIDWKILYYYNYNNRISAEKAHLTFEYDWKKYEILVSITQQEYHSYVDNTDAIIKDIDLEFPCNNTKYKVNLLSKWKRKWVFFDYNLAKQIARMILNDSRF